MRVIIAGGRNITDPQSVIDAVVASGFEVTEVVSGGAPGVDANGEAWARARGLPVRVFPADWDAHGNAAGPIRNRQMADYAEALIAIHDGESRGTADMIRSAETAGLKVFVFGVMP